MADQDTLTLKQRAIQDQVREADRARPPLDMQSAMQAGARVYPEPPFPTDAPAKPGIEDEQGLAPLYDAPYWKGSGKLEGRVAIITGGDSGIGRAVATLFAREGADVAIMHLPHEQQDADTVKARVEKEGRRAVTIAGDVTDRAFCFAAVKRTVDELGGVDVLVNNAAFQLHVSRFEDLTEEHFDLTVKTNLYGYFHMTQACVPHMKPGSAIVNSGSVTGLLGNSTIIDYSMTKGGIHSWTRALSGSLAPLGIRVNAVAPGPVWTPLNPSDNPSKMKSFGTETRMKRPAQPEEIAPAYLFLASPQMSSFITGEILPVIGGYTDR
jgi:NAD(P)-dependent dehydrogenase (short-subunit alcohol dehydrogenase family)